MRPLPVVFALAATLAVSCSSSSDDGALVFPEGFLFGASIAGFQADMGCPTLDAEICDDPNSDWYEFVTSPVTVADGANHLANQSPATGPGHWELFEEDTARLGDELHANGFRFSFEWSRIFPTPTDGIEGYDALKAVASKPALDHYHALLAGLKARGIKPLVTLNHYTLPSWIHDAVGCHEDLDHCSPRGWLDKERTIAEIAKYAGFCAREFGAEVDLWATLNEPFAIVLPGYIFPTPERTNPPSVSMRFVEAKQVIVALIEAHARMYDALKANDLEDADGDGRVSDVGVVYAMTPVVASDPDYEGDVQGAKNLFYLWNMVFLNGAAKGDLDENLDGHTVHREDLANRMDYVGVNYYTRITTRGTAQPFMPELSPLSTFNPLTAELWEDYPRGLYEMLMVVKDELGLPAIVTENGAQDPNDDGTGPSYLVRHLAWVHRAIGDGADVRGYFHWTLMDNYEWNHGMGEVRMGLYAVDKDDPNRTRVPRQAMPVFARIAGERAIAGDLLTKYGAR